jgi:hypothetical protein
MTERWYVRAVLSAAIGLGVLAGLSRGQEPVTNILPRAEIPEYLSAPRSRLQQWWYRHPGHCWAHPNALMCGNGKDDLVFIFGSCRQFYGEPCLKNPPPSRFLWNLVGPPVGDPYLNAPPPSYAPWPDVRSQCPR